MTAAQQITEAASQIPADAQIRPSGDGFKATNPAGISGFFAEISEAVKYVNGQPAQHKTWAGSVFGR